MNFKFLSFLIVAILIAVGGIYFYNSLINPLFQPTTKVDTSRAAIIKDIKQLQRLETASFTIEKIIEAGNEGNVFQQVLYGDKILLIAHGQIIAGFNLANLSEKDIDISGTEVTLRLSKPEILVTSLDNEKTKVYDRKLGLLSKGDKDLEAQARQKAEASIKEAACQANILTEASNNARKQLGVLLSGLGFTKVSIQIPEASCS